MMATSRGKGIDCNVVSHDAAWKSRVLKETQSQLYNWPENYGWLIDEYNQLDAAVRGNDVDKVKPADIRPLNLIDMDDVKNTYEKLKVSEKSSYPITTTGVIGYTPTDADTLRRTASLQRHARPQGDIRKVLGWPPGAD